MGNFIPDRDFIEEEPTEKRIREVLGEYNENIRNFECRNSKAAGKRARANLLELFHLCRQRRKEITDRSKQISWYVHESWEGIEDAS